MIESCSLWFNGFFNSWLSWNEIMATSESWCVTSIGWSASSNRSWSQIWRLIFVVSSVKVTNWSESILIIRSKWILNIYFSSWWSWFCSFSEFTDLLIQSGSIHICLKGLISKYWLTLHLSIFWVLWWWLFRHINRLVHHWGFYFCHV